MANNKKTVRPDKEEAKIKNVTQEEQQSSDEVMKELERLKKENAELKATRPTKSEPIKTSTITHTSGKGLIEFTKIDY